VMQSIPVNTPDEEIWSADASKQNLVLVLTTV